jgi:hypothetical protein
MPYYNLVVVATQRTLSTAARDRWHAVAIFEKEVGRPLTLDHQDAPAPYLLDEWHKGPHWVKPTIPVFESK